MKKNLNLIGLIVLIVISFLLGMVFRGGRSGSSDSDGGRKILYYVDPMHPSYKSDKPGIAPDCGMKLEPVYADGGGPAQVHIGEENADMRPGMVRISSDRQQLIGVKTGIVEKKPVSQMIRVLGRIAVDETRVYRINATINGWITRTYPNATGSLVRKNEVLADFYSPDFLSAQQALIFALSSQDRVGSQSSSNPGRDAQLQQFKINLQQYRDSLRNLGMGELQIDEIIRTRKKVQNVDVTSPAEGIVLTRNVSQGQRFDEGTELFRIADLSHVWILADIFENEAQFFRPGITAKVTLPNQNRTFRARVSNAVPQFDNVSRSLKVRLEADNPGLTLKPDMFVDVELPVNFQPTIAVPVDAVVDTGLRKVVFVDKGDGRFEPRRVETGWRRGGLVEITRGLMEKERIVVSGTFMIDSESRMQAAAMGIYDEGVMDPVCGMYIDEKKARAAGRSVKAAGATFYFCSPDCQHDFEKEPRKYTGSRTDQQADAPHHPGRYGEGKHHDEKMPHDQMQQGSLLPKDGLTPLEEPRQDEELQQEEQDEREPIQEPGVIQSIPTGTRHD